MGFTTPCFIRKNTANIRNRLEEFGYYCNPYVGWRNLYYNLCTNIFGVNLVYSLDDDDTDDLEKIDGLIDCGTNEELFLAIAALRDDTNYMQWFVCTSDYKESDGKEWKVGDFDLNTCPDDFYNILPHWRKATVNELIEHFKEKE